MLFAETEPFWRDKAVSLLDTNEIPPSGQLAAEDRRRLQKSAVLAARRKRRSKVYRILQWAVTPLKSVNFEILSFKFARKRRAFLESYLARDGFHGLHIGCGPNYKDGWVNTDVLIPRLPWSKPAGTEAVQDFPLDLTQPLPFPDESLDAIYGEHVIEHIEKDDALAFFGEARRVLKPGGVLRLSTPDLDGTCRVFLRLDPDVDPNAYEPYWFEEEWSPEFWINATFRFWGHLFLWNFKLFEKELLEAGFDSVWRVEKGETQSDLPELQGIEGRVAIDDEPFARFVAASSLTIEARK